MSSIDCPSTWSVSTPTTLTSPVLPTRCLHSPPCLTSRPALGVRPLPAPAPRCSAQSPPPPPPRWPSSGCHTALEGGEGWGVYATGGVGQGVHVARGVGRDGASSTLVAEFAQDVAPVCKGVGCRHTGCNPNSQPTYPPTHIQQVRQPHPNPYARQTVSPCSQQKPPSCPTGARTAGT